MRPPEGQAIYAPEFPAQLEWIGAPYLRMDRLMGRHCVLLEFWDFARINSLRTLPYLRRWHERYESLGLAVVGVHSPGYSFARDGDTVRRAVERLEIPYPLALDPDYEVWRLYGNHGWPARYLWDRRSVLRYYHYGEGDYQPTELAIQECLSEIEPFEAPEPLEPLRPEDAPGAEMERQTAEIRLPADRLRLELVRDWSDGEDFIEAADAGAAAAASFRAGAAFAVLSEGGLAEPGLYETDGTVVASDPGLRLHGFQFTPIPPA